MNTRNDHVTSTKLLATLEELLTAVGAVPIFRIDDVAARNRLIDAVLAAREVLVTIKVGEL